MSENKEEDKKLADKQKEISNIEEEISKLQEKKRELERELRNMCKHKSVILETTREYPYTDRRHNITVRSFICPICNYMVVQDKNLSEYDKDYLEKISWRGYTKKEVTGWWDPDNVWEKNS